MCLHGRSALGFRLELPQLSSNIDIDSNDESTGDGIGDWFSEVSDDSDSECEMEQLPETDESDIFSPYQW